MAYRFLATQPKQLDVQAHPQALYGYAVATFFAEIKGHAQRILEDWKQVKLGIDFAMAGWV